ncbi:MAG: Uma2 family endonuclease [Thermoanaerobaculia bacterium]
MTQLAVSSSVPLKLEFGDTLHLSDDELFELCARNRDLRIERTAAGNLIVMSPTGARTGTRNAALTAAVWNWTAQDATGAAFDSSTGFRLPNGAMRSPDVAWVLRSRLEPLSAEEKEKFLPLVPDFVIELLSPSDERTEALEKMEEWRDNGARLGWLIDPIERRVHVYRPGQAVEVLEQPSQLSGDPELSGFVLNLQPIWQPV